ncbi:MAG: hypothetical protein AB7F75_03215 [Planctomycetota bacterium]
MPPRNIYAVDMGSNAIRSLRIDRHGEEHKSRIPLRLGADVFATGRLRPATLAKLRRIFLAMAAQIKRHHPDHVGAVGTSALREAGNASQVVNAAKRAGIPLEVISGHREAILIHRAVVTRHKPKGPWLLLDIGGGSAELVFSRGSKARHVVTLPLGAVRLMELLRKKKLSQADLMEHVSFQVAPLLRKIRRQAGGSVPLVIATGGSSKALGRVANKWFGDASLDAGQFEWLAYRLREMSSSKLKRLFGTERNRLDVVIPATLVLLSVMRLADARTLRLSKRGLIDGLADELGES